MQYQVDKLLRTAALGNISSSDPPTTQHSLTQTLTQTLTHTHSLTHTHHTRSFFPAACVHEPASPPQDGPPPSSPHYTTLTHSNTHTNTHTHSLTHSLTHTHLHFFQQRAYMNQPLHHRMVLHPPPLTLQHYIKRNICTV